MYSRLLQQWREADYAARAAEARILAAESQAVDDASDSPTLADRVHVTNLRAAANALLAGAMSEIHSMISMSSIARIKADGSAS
jgi:hypothetical protein